MSNKYKGVIFEKYLLWRSIPKPAVRLSLAVLGNLSEIKDQREFSVRFGINERTLSRWNKDPRLQDTAELSRFWAREMIPGVITALYRRVVKTGNAAEVKTFLEYALPPREKHGQMTMHEFFLSLPKHNRTDEAAD